MNRWSATTSMTRHLCCCATSTCARSLDASLICRAFDAYSLTNPPSSDAAHMPWRDRARHTQIPRHFDARSRRVTKRSTDALDEALGRPIKAPKREMRPRQPRPPPPARDAAREGIFAHVTAYIDGWTPEGATAVREAIASRGGVVALYYDKTTVTHYIVESYDTMDADARARVGKYASTSSSRKAMVCARSAWVMESVKRDEALDVEAFAPFGDAPKAPSAKATTGHYSATDLVDVVINAAWNGTGGVGTQEGLSETWCVKVVFEGVERAMTDGKTKDADARKLSTQAYKALKRVVDAKWVIPVGASEALVDLSGMRNFQKRNRFESSQTSPANAAEMLEWVMIDKTGVNVRATMHNMREDGWGPEWLVSEADTRDRTSMESCGVLTRRGSREAASRVALSQESHHALDTQTLSQVSNIDDETLNALDPQTRYEWQKARENAAKKKFNHERAKQSAVFQLLSATGKLVGDTKGASKAALSPLKKTLQPNMARRTPPQPKRIKSSGAQLSIKSFASPVKAPRPAPASARSFVGEAVMASARVHTPTLMHAFVSLLERDAVDPVPDRVGAACAVMRAHIEQLERDGRRAAARQVRAAVTDIRCPENAAFTEALRDSVLTRGRSDSLGINSQ